MEHTVVTITHFSTQTQVSRPYKSTTHEERYVHIQTPHHPRFNGATVFMRREDDGHWRGTAAFCSAHDQFCRRTGRQVARRRYFAMRDRGELTGPRLTPPKYDALQAEVLALMDQI